MKLKCLIIDDEPVARRGLAEYARDVEFLDVVAEFESALTAAPCLQDRTIDLMFLDVQMPKLTGIDFLKSLSHPPMTILTTAYADYALEGYALDVIDYLIKPIAFDRFMKAAHKALDFHRMKSSDKVPDDYFFIKCNGRFEKVAFREVLFAESLQNYVIIHTADKKLITYLTLGSLQEQLPADQFMKVHKSYIVSLQQIDSVDGDDMIIGSHRIPISRSLKEEVHQKVIGRRLFKR